MCLDRVSGINHGHAATQQTVTQKPINCLYYSLPAYAAYYTMHSLIGQREKEIINLTWTCREHLPFSHFPPPNFCWSVVVVVVGAFHLCLFAAIFLSLWKWIGSDTDSQSQLFSRITSYRMWNEIQISRCFCERRVLWCTYDDLFGGTKGSTESDSAIAHGWHCLCMPSANVKTINFGCESQF